MQHDQVKGHPCNLAHTRVVHESARQRRRCPEEFGGTVAKEFVILTISTDYFRYIGTNKATAKFKKSLLEARHSTELNDEETPDKTLMKALLRPR